MDVTGRKMLVTCGLPYANGSLHLGHMVEYIMADIYVRFLKMTGQDVIYICGSDTHGTPIEINAAKHGVAPEEFVAKYHREIQEDFAAFQVQFDNYYTTHSPQNRHYAELIFERLRQRGDIVTRESELAYCASCARFLPDRYLRGSCPKCSAPDQYGDVCEVCDSTYDPTELVDARCALC
jgi:methionyl-tRNA synthetase